MKITLISPYDFAFPSGVNNNVIHTAACFREWGHDVTIMGSCSRDETSLPLDFIRARGRVLPLPFAGSKARVSLSPQAYRQIKKLLQRGQFDVIHLHEPMIPALPLAALRHAPLCPQSLFVGTFHAYQESSAGYHYARPLLKRFFERLDGRIAVSSAARDYIKSYFDGDYVIIPNGIDVERFGDEEIEPWPRYQDGKLNILFVGRLERRKGFRFLLQAFRRVKKVMPQTRLIVVGAYNEDDKRPFVEYTQEHQLADVCFTGWISDEDLPRYYRSCDVFCAPSIGFESFGLVLLEAMAAGKPIITSDIPGYRTVLDDGREGMMVPPEDEKTLARALIWLLRNPAIRRRMGQRGRAKAQTYTWRQVSEQILSHYQELMAQRG
ncbi:MAG: glycosyltransferase family 4 protein [Chloroflexota bacterium]|nr:glycosyltransferase family 4 protein [Chloroflexota bacterium]